jgi:hypothetical protein
MEVCIMAEAETTTVAPGVTREDCEWCYWLTGTKDDLLRAGLAHETWFANGKRDKRGRVIRSIHAEHEGRTICCTEQQRTGRHQIQVQFTDEEVERARQCKRFEDIRKAERERIASMPGSHDDFRATAMIIAKSALYALHCSVLRGTGGYRFAPETIEELKRANVELLAVLQDGKTVFSQERRQAEIAKIKTDTIAANPELADLLAPSGQVDARFQRFMSQAISGPSTDGA